MLVRTIVTFTILLISFCKLIAGTDDNNSSGFYYSHGFVIINKAPEKYKEIFLYADSCRNGNNLLDCIDEAAIAVQRFINLYQDREEFVKFINYMGEAGYYVFQFQFVDEWECFPKKEKPREFFEQPKTLDAKALLSKRKELTEKINNLDSEILEQYKYLEDFDRDGAKLGIKIKKDKMRMGLNIRVMAMSGMLETCTSLETKMEFIDWVQAREVDMNLLKDCINYLMKEKDLNSISGSLEWKVCQYKRFDEQLDSIGNIIMENDRITLDNDEIEQNAIAGLPMKNNTDTNNSISQTLSLKSLRQLNDSLLNLYFHELENYENISKFNDLVNNFNHRVEEFDNKNNIILSKIEENKKGIRKLSNISDKLLTELKDGKEISRESWEQFCNIIKYKLTSWELYVQCYEQDMLNKELRKEEKRFNQQVALIQKKRDERQIQRNQLEEKKLELIK
jgi:hypothetical protein